jgi:Excalibur calcium-binding domain
MKLSAIVLIALALTASLAATATARPNVSYPNCKALNRVYPHGVGKYGARDHTSVTPVTNFKRSNRLYRQNIGHDRDHDGIACEKR